MSEVYTILEVGDAREWSSERHGGRFLAYPLTLEGVEGLVEWSRKHDSDSPKVGDRIPGNIENSQHGKKLKVDWDALKEQGGGASSGGSRSNFGGKRDWTPEGERDPGKVARIGRQAAIKAAISILIEDKKFVPTSVEAKRAMIEEWVRWIEGYVDAAAKKTAQGSGESSDSRQSPGPAQDDTYQSLSSLLEAAGVNSAATRVVADYAVAEMHSAEQDAAIQCLQDPKRQASAVKRLRERTEEHFGVPLPETESDDSDIPF